jgi:hypothetical protein
VHPEAPGFIGTGSYHASASPCFRVCANDDWPASESGMITLFDGSVESVHVHMEYRSLHDCALVDRRFLRVGSYLFTRIFSFGSSSITFERGGTLLMTQVLPPMIES